MIRSLSVATHHRIVIVGRLGQEPDARVTSKGKPRTVLRVWTKHTAPAEDGEPIEHTEWFRVVCWEGYAKAAAEYLHKGSRVYIEGRVQSRSYEKDGQKHYVTEVITSLLKFIDLEEQPAELTYRKLPARKDAA